MGVIFINPYRFAAFSPLDLSPALWLDASDTSTITSSGSPATVSQWNDKSGNGRNVTQATAANQPGTGAVTQNGLNVLTFAADDLLKAATASDWKFLSDGTVVLVAFVAQFGTVSNPNARYAMLGTVQPGVDATSFIVAYDDRASASRNDRLVHAVGRANVPTEALVNVTADNAVTPNIATLVSLIQKPTDATAALRSSLYINGGSVIANNTNTGSVTAGNPGSPLNVGYDGSFYLTGRVAEIVIVSGANATEANRVALRDYLNTKWAVY